MQTNFSLAQLADPAIEEAEGILRKCVHCGFCTATCPTYVLLGDELDSPRGRIYLIKDMLENDRPADARVATHLDRCLSCLSCMTTCPSGVNYMHLIDHARHHVEKTFARPTGDRLLRALLARVLPSPGLFRLALKAARLAGPLAALAPGRMKGMVAMAPDRLPAQGAPLEGRTFPAEGKRRMRVALMPGCAQQVLSPQINAATIRVLTRHGCEVVVARDGGCCGALVHHMGRADEALAAARRNVAAWSALADDGGLDAVAINASGCGTTVKDYGFLLRDDPDWAERAARVSGLARDVSELLAEIDIAPSGKPSGLRVAYHAACSLQHGQQIRTQPKAVLAAAGFEVREVPEGHLCCGSAGTYNLLQPAIAERLRARKVANIESTGAQVVAAGNLGCIVQIASGTRLPVVHSVELIDWATGGPLPSALEGRLSG